MAISRTASLALALATCSLTPAAGQPRDYSAEIGAVTAKLEAFEREHARETASLKAEIAELKRQLDVERTTHGESEVPKASQAEVAQVASVRNAGAAFAVDLPDPNTAIAVPPGPIGRALQAAGSDFELLAAADSTRVSIRLTQDIAETRLLGAPEGPATTTRASISLSSPTNKKSPRSDVFTSDGFPSDFEARIGLNWYKRTLRNPILYQPALDMVAAARIKCTERAGQIANEKYKEAALRECAATKVDGNWIRQAYGGQDGIDKEREYLALQFPRGGTAFGLEARAGYKQHDFVDLAALKMEDDTLTPWGVRAYYGFIPKPLTSFTGSIDYTEGKKDAKAGVICPLGAGMALKCLSGALGPPKKEERLNLALEYRQMFVLPQDWLLKGVGVAAQVAHDIKNDRTVLDLPIYLVPDAKQNFTGGIRLGWNSEDHDVVAGVFVSSAFGTRPQ